MKYYERSCFYSEDEISPDISEAEMYDLRANHFVRNNKQRKVIKNIFQPLNLNEEYGKRIFGDKYNK